MLKTISETPVTFAKAKNMLEAKEAQLHENDKELGHEQKITLEYLRTIPILETKVAEETAKALIEAVDILKEHQVMTLINILPDCAEDVELIFAKERIKPDKDQTQKIVDIIKKVKPKKVVKKVLKKVKEKIVATEDDKPEEVTVVEEAKNESEDKKE